MVSTARKPVQKTQKNEIRKEHTMTKASSIDKHAYDQKKFYADFELNIDVITDEINNYIQNRGGCPVILSGLGPI